MSVLAFDLGTTTGWCYLSLDPLPLLGHKYLVKPNKPLQDPFDPRPGQFFDLVIGLIAEHKPDVLAYERVRAHRPGAWQAAHLYGMFRGVVCLMGPSLIGVEVAQAKRALTGAGNASKARVVEAAEKILGYKPTEDEADALGVAIAAQDIHAGRS